MPLALRGELDHPACRHGAGSSPSRTLDLALARNGRSCSSILVPSGIMPIDGRRAAQHQHRVLLLGGLLSPRPSRIDPAATILSRIPLHHVALLRVDDVVTPEAWLVRSFTASVSIAMIRPARRLPAVDRLHPNAAAADHGDLSAATSLALCPHHTVAGHHTAPIRARRSAVCPGGLHDPHLVHQHLSAKTTGEELITVSPGVPRRTWSILARRHVFTVVSMHITGHPVGAILTGPTWNANRHVTT